MIDSIMMSLLGGVLIGTAASALLLAIGRVCGISGILGELISSFNQDTIWRAAFIIGLITGGILLMIFSATAISLPSHRSMMTIVFAGLLVGYGTRLGGGCTSGHGICGLTRFSQRSLVATLTFMAAGFATATTIGFFKEGV
jgi:uncharacterized membrane protein YedE/YeeE